MASPALLISVRPVYAERILAGEKTVELRRVRPHVEPGAAMLIYASSPTKALLGFATVEAVETRSVSATWSRVRADAGISRTQYREYFDGATAAVAIWISDVTAFSRPVPLSEIRVQWPWLRPPQSYRFVHAAVDMDEMRLLELFPT